jgi:hypothetical protein
MRLNCIRNNVATLKAAGNKLPNLAHINHGGSGNVEADVTYGPTRNFIFL